jgi:DNA mismatch repair protein MutS2
MSLHAQTREALDWPMVVRALAERARTPIGARRARALEALTEVQEVLHAFDEVDEVLALRDRGEDPPLGGVEDIATDVVRARKGEALSGAELRRCGLSLGSLRDVSWFFERHAEDSPNLSRRAQAIVVDDRLADELLAAFDSDGALSSRTYPELGELRRRITDLHAGVRHTLQEMLRGEDLRDLLQDDFVTQRNDRYVLPIKAHARRWDLGIVHGASGSGQTVYIEPKQVVELNNQLRLAEADLEQAERRILGALTHALGASADPVLVSLDATADLDLAVARADLAVRLGATRPHVGEAGCVRLENARHPVLVLRGVEVVGNDLSVNTDQPALVLSGPNAGGKTVSLKTLGLCAMLVQHGCFVPAAHGARVDLCAHVLAAIGDAQSVEGDLSSFSGHLLVLAQMLQAAGPGTLLLLDEIASGTDPAQGAALAQAVLEELLDRGGRVVVTTHFSRLKALSTADARFSSAAVEYADGQPTYRVLAGLHGQSHALSIAARMGLSSKVLGRARDLMDQGERDLADLLSALEHARAEAEDARREAHDQAQRLAERERQVDRRERELKTRTQALADEASAGFRARLADAERAISAVVADLQRDPDHQRVRAARSTLDAFATLAPEQTPPTQAPPAWTVGDAVRLIDSGVTGIVAAVHDDVAVVEAGALRVRVPLSKLTSGSPPQPPPLDRKPKKARSPKPTATALRETPIQQALRLPTNTLDLRGQRVDETLESIDRFFDRALRSGHDVVFLLHGHGTGQLKGAIRRWLPQHAAVRDWAPAMADQGGDAFTVVRLGLR